MKVFFFFFFIPEVLISNGFFQTSRYPEKNGFIPIGHFSEGALFRKVIIPTFGILTHGLQEQ